VGGEEDRHPELDRQRLQASDGGRELLVLHPGARRQHLERVDHREPGVEHPAQRVGHLADPAGRGLLDEGRAVAEAQRCGSDPSPRGLVERSAPQVVDPGAPLDRQHPLERAVGGHLAGQVSDAPPSLGGAQGDGQGERGLPAPHVAAEDDEVPAANTPPEQPVDAREAGGDRVRRHGTVDGRVDAPHEEGERGGVGGSHDR
jgi:hypothetical protein